MARVPQEIEIPVQEVYLKLLHGFNIKTEPSSWKLLPLGGVKNLHLYCEMNKEAQILLQDLLAERDEMIEVLTLWISTAPRKMVRQIKATSKVLYGKRYFHPKKRDGRLRMKLLDSKRGE